MGLFDAEFAAGFVLVFRDELAVQIGEKFARRVIGDVQQLVGLVAIRVPDRHQGRCNPRGGQGKNTEPFICGGCFILNSLARPRRTRKCARLDLDKDFVPGPDGEIVVTVVGEFDRDRLALFAGQLDAYDRASGLNPHHTRGHRGAVQLQPLDFQFMRAHEDANRFPSGSKSPVLNNRSLADTGLAGLHAAVEQIDVTEELATTNSEAG